MSDKDNGKTNAPSSAQKRYQNSDYPAGSFEDAIAGDQRARLRDGGGLRLERQPVGDPSSEIEEMVPAFMHRDFFRSEEDAVEAVRRKSRALLPARKSVEVPSPVPGYVEPPMTESDDADAPTVPVAQMETPKLSPTRSAAAPVAPKTKPVLPPLPENEPLLAPLRSSNGDPLASASPISPKSLSEEPAVPLRSAPGPSQASTTAVPQVESPAPVGSDSAASTRSPYSAPLVAALVLVVGLFLYREGTRPTVPEQEALAVPQTVATAQPSATPAALAADGASKFVAVGPPVPAPDARSTAADVSPTPGPDDSAQGGEEALPPGDAEAATQSEDDAASTAGRAAILERMNSAENSPASQDSDSDSLFPATAEEEAPRSAPVRSVGGPAPNRPSPSRPAPSRPAAAKPVPVKVATKKPVAASAADLFPIDDEVPIAPSRPIARPAAVQQQAPVQPQPSVPALAPSHPAGEPYEISEPNL